MTPKRDFDYAVTPLAASPKELAWICVIIAAVMIALEVLL